MILFYSKFCDHCNMLLDTIKRHDNNKTIKLVSIDYLKSNNYMIDQKIHSVPALYINESKEYIFGKNVFDYLLLPSRGKLLIQNRDTKERDKSIINGNVSEMEPHGFSITNTISQVFEGIDDNNNINDINFGFTKIDNNIPNNNIPNNNIGRIPIEANDNIKESKKLPSLEDIMKMRDLDLK